MGRRRSRRPSRVGADGVDAFAQPDCVDPLASAALDMVVVAAGALDERRDCVRHRPELQAIPRRSAAVAHRHQTVASRSCVARDSDGSLCRRTSRLRR